MSKEQMAIGIAILGLIIVNWLAYRIFILKCKANNPESQRVPEEHIPLTVQPSEEDDGQRN